SIAASAVDNNVLKVNLPRGLSSVYFIRLDLKHTSGKPISHTFYWASTQPYTGPQTYTGPLYGGFAAIKKLPRITLKTVLTQKPDTQVDLGDGTKRAVSHYTVTVNNPSSSLAFFIDLKLM